MTAIAERTAFDAMNEMLPFGEERDTFRECNPGDWVPSATEGPGPNIPFHCPKGAELWEFALILHSGPDGDRWVWKRVT